LKQWFCSYSSVPNLILALLYIQACGTVVVLSTHARHMWAYGIVVVRMTHAWRTKIVAKKCKKTLLCKFSVKVCIFKLFVVMVFCGYKFECNGGDVLWQRFNLYGM
jgi:hypothetical protein